MFPANWKLDIHKLGLLPCYPATGVNAVGLRVLWAHKLRFGESAISVWIRKIC